MNKDIYVEENVRLFEMLYGNGWQIMLPPILLKI